MLSERKYKAIEAILTTRTIKDAAKISGVPLRTIRKWMKDDTDFQQELCRRHDEVLQECVRSSRAALHLALDSLREILASRDTKPGEKIQAARVLIDADLRLDERAVLTQRVEELEKAVGDAEK